MVYSYTPTYYSTLQDSITSICKNILPFNLKKRRLPAAEQRLSRLQSENLKWQQDSFHQILNLMGLHKEGILADSEVSAFRTLLLDSLISAPPEQDPPLVLRDKLLFLQELLFAKCISPEEYHASKRPLIQRLAVQGAEIEARDVIVGDLPKEENKNIDDNDNDNNNNPEEVWSVIDLKDETRSVTKEKSNSKNKSLKPATAMKHVLGFVSSYKPGKAREEKKSIFDLEVNKENETSSILMPESSNQTKRQPFKSLFHKEENGNTSATKSAKRHWGFKKWNKSDSEDETRPLSLNERSDSEAFADPSQLVAIPIGEGPDTKLIKRKLHNDGAPSDFFIDKVLADKIKMELTRIQSELGDNDSNLKFSNEQIEAISTKLPVDKTELNNLFPKSWCDRYGDVVVDVVKKEFKEHVGEMESLRNEAMERRKSNNNSKRWTTFDDEDCNDNENFHPNLFSRNNNINIDDNGLGLKRSESALLQHQNPFWSPRHGSSMLA